MLNVDSIKPNNLAFNGKEKVKKPKSENKKGIGYTLTKPVRDSFHKAYGKHVKVTPALVADFIADNIIKIGIVTVGTVLLFAKMKSATNGLTSAVRKAAKEDHGLGKKFTEVIGQIKENNADFVKKTREAVRQAGNFSETGAADKTLNEVQKAGGLKSFIKNVFKPKEAFNESGLLGRAIKKVAGEKKAPVVMEKLAQAGIAGGSDVLDTAVAVGATATVGSGLINIAKDVTEADNKKLAKESGSKHVVKSIGKISKLAELAGV